MQKRFTALVVDDSLEQAECLARLLDTVGHHATFVIHPLDALDAVEALHPEMVFVDIDMPQMDGWALANLLRQRITGAPSRLVAVSGLEDLPRRARPLFDAYLVKPVTLDALNEVFAFSA
jgi:CheY-like chemotaxis protein